MLAAGATVTVGFGVGRADTVDGTAYTRTVVGTEFHAIDFRVAAQFAAGSDGGVYTHVPSGAVPTQVYLEAPVALPVGATVTAVTFYYFDCGFPDPLVKFYFGGYNPLTKAYAEIQPEASGGSGVCLHAYALTRSQPKRTVQTGYRYILGVHSFYASQGASPPSDVPWVISGARVRFTCPTSCAP
jgi:hypothetical protein